MIATALRALFGLTLVRNIYREAWPSAMPHTLRGTENRDSKTQEFINTTARAMGVSKPILLREDPEHEFWPKAHSVGTNLLPGKAQIFLAKNHPFDEDALKFTCAHEIAHIANNDCLIKLALRVFTVAILFNPYVPHWTAIAVGFTLSTAFLIPLLRRLERRADFLGLQHSSAEGALRMLTLKERFYRLSPYAIKSSVDSLEHPSTASRRAMAMEFLERELQNSL